MGAIVRNVVNDQLLRLSYKDMYNKDNWELTGAKMVVVDGEKIKEDTYYRCIEGEIVEVTEDGEIVEE